MPCETPLLRPKNPPPLPDRRTFLAETLLLPLLERLTTKDGPEEESLLRLSFLVFEVEEVLDGAAGEEEAEEGADVKGEADADKAEKKRLSFIDTHT